MSSFKQLIIMKYLFSTLLKEIEVEIVNHVSDFFSPEGLIASRV